MDRGPGNPYPRLNTTTTSSSSFSSDTLFSSIPSADIDIVTSELTQMACTSDASSPRPQYSSLYERLISKDRHLLFGGPVKSPVLSSSPPNSQWIPASKPLTSMHKIDASRSKRPMSFSGFSPIQQLSTHPESSQPTSTELAQPQPSTQHSFMESWSMPWDFDFGALSHVQGGESRNDFHTVTDSNGLSGVGTSAQQTTQPMEANAQHSTSYNNIHYPGAQISTYSEFAAHIAVFSKPPQSSNGSVAHPNATNGSSQPIRESQEQSPPSSASPESLTDSHSGPPTPENHAVSIMPISKKPERTRSLNGRRASLGPSCSHCRDRKIQCTGPQEGRTDGRCRECARRQATCEYPHDPTPLNKRGRKKAASRSHEVGKVG
jgi:hypothetical protein